MNGDRIKVWPEGSELTDLAEERQVGNRSWRRVRDVDGNEGWVASEYLTAPTEPTLIEARAAEVPSTVTPVSGPLPTSPPVPQTTFSSGGLGLVRSDWERGHGSPSRAGYYVSYENGRFVVGFLDGKVYYLERSWGDRDAVPLETARGTSKYLLPADARAVKTYTLGGDRTVDLYLSDSLRSRFSAAPWTGGDPGNFTVLFRTRPPDGHVTSILFGLGNNPT